MPVRGEAGMLGSSGPNAGQATRVCKVSNENYQGNRGRTMGSHVSMLKEQEQ